MDYVRQILYNHQQGKHALGTQMLIPLEREQRLVSSRFSSFIGKYIIYHLSYVSVMKHGFISTIQNPKKSPRIE
jgi:hypothetical protein